MPYGMPYSVKCDRCLARIEHRWSDGLGKAVEEHVEACWFSQSDPPPENTEGRGKCACVKCNCKVRIRPRLTPGDVCSLCKKGDHREDDD